MVNRIKPVKRRRPSKKSSRRQGKSSPTSAATRSVRLAIEQCRKAQELLSSRALGVLAVADRLGEAAKEECLSGLARDFAGQQFPRDVVALRDAFAEVPSQSLPAGLEVLRKLPAALLQWLDEHMRLTPELCTGQELEVPAKSLENFQIEGENPAASHGLAKIKVLAPGWKYKGKGILPPQVEILA